MAVTFLRHTIIHVYIYDLVPKGAHARGYACIHIRLSAKRCACKGLCTSVENKTLLKTVFILNVVLCTCMNE